MYISNKYLHTNVNKIHQQPLGLINGREIIYNSHDNYFGQPSNQFYLYPNNHGCHGQGGYNSAGNLNGTKQYMRNQFSQSQKNFGFNLTSQNINTSYPVSQINYNQNINKTNTIGAQIPSIRQSQQAISHQNNVKQINKKQLKLNQGYHRYLKTETDQSNNNNTLSKNKNINNNLYKNNRKYQIEGVAGKGTFGIVYHGRMVQSRQKIALKKVFQDKKYKNRQLQILKQIKHPNILQMKDYFITNQGNKQYLNIIMEYFNDNLFQIIQQSSFKPFITKIYTFQILRGLNYLATLNIAHRDIKPQNILIDNNTHKLVICDFGSAKKLVDNEINIAYICSRCYRAPQLIFGATNYTGKIDMWAAGCVIVQMVNGKAPFIGQNQFEQLIEIIKVLGTPQKYQIQQMNSNFDLNQCSQFPNIKPISWKKTLKTQDPLLIDLITKIMQYSPTKRLSALQALKHPYFDQLHELSQQKHHQYLLTLGITNIYQFFNFTSNQIASLGIKEKAIKINGRKQGSKVNNGDFGKQIGSQCVSGGKLKNLVRYSSQRRSIANWQYFGVDAELKQQKNQKQVNKQNKNNLLLGNKNQRKTYEPYSANFNNALGEQINGWNQKLNRNSVINSLSYEKNGSLKKFQWS